VGDLPGQCSAGFLVVDDLWAATNVVPAFASLGGDFA
jgi:hypothetical protein